MITRLVLCGLLLIAIACKSTTGSSNRGTSDGSMTPSEDDPALIASGKNIFRFETFGDETFWTDTLRMHEVISSAVDPTTALSVGLKVDSDSLPPAVVQGIHDGSISLTSPATTVALLKLNAVVGLKGTVTTVNGQDVLTSVGITCALCHSTVDNSFSAGIGKRLDGWPNHDLNAGAIIALSSALTPAQKAVYNSWGKGKYDARYNFDGLNGPALIPPAYGLRGVASITYTGDGANIAYWNRYVAVTQMHGHGSWVEVGISPPENVQNPPDKVTAKLAALQAYQLSLETPPAPAGTFNVAAAARGRLVFEGVAQCSSCHAGNHFTDAPGRLHNPADVVSEGEVSGPSLASRSVTKMYRTTPLRGLWQRSFFFHNGAATALEEVVGLYNSRKSLGLSIGQRADLVNYLRSL
ncbi:MAG TPA: hypothetical protein VK478_09465 [Gemmatimonadaceae bacterium]|nr:hypothetical protein [Gemmatimonadaceae bacterium]